MLKKIMPLLIFATSNTFAMEFARDKNTNNQDITLRGGNFQIDNPFICSDIRSDLQLNPKAIKKIARSVLKALNNMPTEDARYTLKNLCAHSHLSLEDNTLFLNLSEEEREFIQSINVNSLKYNEVLNKIKTLLKKLISSNKQELSSYTSGEKAAFALSVISVATLLFATFKIIPVVGFLIAETSYIGVLLLVGGLALLGLDQQLCNKLYHIVNNLFADVIPNINNIFRTMETYFNVTQHNFTDSALAACAAVLIVGALYTYNKLRIDPQILNRKKAKLKHLEQLYTVMGETIPEY